MAAVAMSNGVNANLLRRWVIEAERQDAGACTAEHVPAPSFVALQLPDPPAPAPAPQDIRISLQRGAITISVTWPTNAAAECATWLRELLR